MSLSVSPPSEELSNSSGLSAAAQQRADFLAHLIRLSQKTPAIAPCFQPLRDQAIARLQSQSFPTTRDEEWRFTDLSNLVQLQFDNPVAHHSAVNIDGIADFALPEAENSRLVFVNGVYASEFSTVRDLPEGVIVSNLSALAGNGGDRLQSYLGQQLGSEELFTTLNTAGFSDGAIVLIPKNVVVEKPIHLLFIATTTFPAAFLQPRCLVVAERHSSVTLVEDFVSVGREQSFTNAVTEIWVADNARVNHTRVQRDSLSAFHIGKTAVSQARDSHYACNAIHLGAALSRHHLEVYQTGEQTSTTLNGLTMLKGEQVSDTHSAIAFTKPYGTSRQLHKCIADDRAHAIFNGKVFVPKLAQLTDAGQLNCNLLLSPKARIDTKPQLEIVADNVKCTHGATVGQLETDEVFYLQSRGIDAASARRLLVHAFAYEILDQIPVPSLKQALVAHPI